MSGVVYPGLFGLGMAGQGAQGSRIRAVTHTWPLLTRSAIYGPECEHKHGVKSRYLKITNGTLNLGIITRHPLALVWGHPAMFRLRHRPEISRLLHGSRADGKNLHFYDCILLKQKDVPSVTAGIKKLMSK